MHGFITILTATILAIIVRPDRDDREYRALATDYSAVCWIEACGGTGTLVSPQWVLTAAHNVDDVVAVDGDYAVSFGGVEYEIAEIVVHPEYSMVPPRGGVDLALLRLKTPVTSVQALPIYVDNQELGMTATIVGFGHTGTFATGQEGRSTFKPTLRAGTNVISDVRSSGVYRYLYTTIDKHDSATNLESAIGAGDSGGPAVVHVDGRPFIAGVAAYSPGGGSGDIRPGYGDQDGFVRVSRFAIWIEDVTGQDFDAPGRFPRWPLLVLLASLPIGLFTARRARHDKQMHRNANVRPVSK